MEQSPSIFSLSVDPVTKSHLSEASRWARFLAIAGMISLALLILAGIYLSMNLTDKINQQYDGEFKPSTGLAQSVGIGMVIMYLIIAIIWFFPLLFLLRFANQVQSAILSNNQESLNSAFQNLKVCFRYVGIVTIIGMAFYLLAIVITITTGQTV